MIKQYRNTWVEIDLDNVWFNYTQAQKKAPGKTIIPVLKADAYGHGAVEIMKHLYQKGVKIAAVSLLEEAMELRAEFADIEIIVMGPVLEQDLDVASSNNIEITIYDDRTFKWVEAFENKIKCHLIIDTGMSRYGIIKMDNIVYIANQLSALKHVEFKSIYTHFATANDNKILYDKQLMKFKEALAKLKKTPPMVHISNSSSTFKYESSYDFTTHVRIGISLYGMILDDVKPEIKPAMTFKTKVIQLKHLKKGDFVGYGTTYEVEKDEIIAIVPVGYADGFHRSNKNGEIEINKKRYKIVGKICMDACFVKVDDSVHIQDTAIMFGGIVSIDEVAKRLDTVQHEICTSISYRVPKKYLKGRVII